MCVCVATCRNENKIGNHLIFHLDMRLLPLHMGRQRAHGVFFNNDSLVLTCVKVHFISLNKKKEKGQWTTLTMYVYTCSLIEGSQSL